MPGQCSFVGECLAEEISQIAAIEREIFTDPWTEEMLYREFLLPLSTMIVARGHEVGEEATVIGYLIFWQVSNECHLHRLAVRKEKRRQGTATSLLLAMLTGVSFGHCRGVTLEVRSKNQPALRLYKKFGFAIEGVRPRYYDDTGDDALVLWLRRPDSFPGREGFYKLGGSP